MVSQANQNSEEGNEEDLGGFHEGQSERFNDLEKNEKI